MLENIQSVESLSPVQIMSEQEVLGRKFKIYGGVDNPLFMAKDVAEWIDHSQVSKMLLSIDDNEKLIGTMFLSGQSREMWFLTEDGLYEVLMQSRKPIAKEFKKQVKIILSSIRKNGAYMTSETIEQALTSPDFLIKLANKLKEEQEARMKLEIEKSKLTVDNMIMRPKAEYFDELVDRNLLTNFRETSHELKISEKSFIEYLLDKGYVYRDGKGKLKAYAHKNKELFETKECYNEKTNWRGTQVLITPKGRETFRLLIGNLKMN